jgi:hypothetical protein
MDIIINIVEIATELAEQKLSLEYCLENYDKFYTMSPNGERIYTIEAQVIFDEAYDEYYDLLFKNQIK